MAVEGPMTELVAVNLMLRAINEQPRDTLTADTSVDVTIAQRVLAETTREVLGQGWWFNKDERYEIAANGSGYVLLPTNAISIMPHDSEAYAGLVERSGKFYSMTDQTDVLSRSVLANIVWGFDFIYCPHEVQRYVAHKAARKFVVASRNKSEPDASTEEALALAELQRRDLNETRNTVNLVGRRRTGSEWRL